MAHRILRCLVIYALLMAALFYGMKSLPTSFLPNEDQGIMFMMVQTPAGATAERTLESVEKVEEYFLETQKDTVKHLFTVVGFSFAGSAERRLRLYCPGRLG